MARPPRKPLAGILLKWGQMHCGKFQEGANPKGGGNPILNIGKANCQGGGQINPKRGRKHPLAHPEINPDLWPLSQLFSIAHAILKPGRSLGQLRLHGMHVDCLPQYFYFLTYLPTLLFIFPLLPPPSLPPPPQPAYGSAFSITTRGYLVQKRENKAERNWCVLDGSTLLCYKEAEVHF